MNIENYKSAKEFLKYGYSVSNVARGFTYWQKFFLAKCQNLFYYKNLPATMPAWEIEKSLIIKGSGGVVKKNGNLYIPFQGMPYGFDVYMVPNKFTFANPVIGGQSGLEDEKNVAIIWNSEIDKIEVGKSFIFDCINRYSRMLADLESTFTNALVFSRAGLACQVSDESEAQTFKTFTNTLKSGEVDAIISKSIPFDKINSFNFNPITTYSGFTECRDYLINCFYNDVGMQTLEEKKERMISNELYVDGDVLENNIDILYVERIKNVEKINKIWGTNIEVYKNEILGKEDSTENCEEKVVENKEEVQE